MGQISPPKTQILLLVKHMYPTMKVYESVGRREKLAVRPRKFVTHKNTRDLMKLNKYWKVVQWVKSLGETPMTVFTLGICMCEGVSEDSGHGTG